jgi:hypothetical protein
VSGLVIEARAQPARPTFLRLLWAVLLGYLAASLTLGVLAIGLDALGLLPRPFLRPGPFPVSGAWSLDADLLAALAVVLVAAWWIRRMVADAAKSPVSFGIVALSVAATGFAPYLALRPVALTGLLALPLTTWLVRRYALDRTLPLPQLSGHLWLVLAVAGLLLFASYRVYHPLNSFGVGAGGGSGGSFRVLSLRNSGFADLTIQHVAGGGVFSEEGPWVPTRLPYTVRARSSADVFVRGSVCRSRTVAVTYSVLGRTATQQFAVNPAGCRP